MCDQKEKKVDQGLAGNETIEQYIEMLQKEPSQEMLAVTLTSIRRRMQAGGQMIVALDAGAGTQMQIQMMQVENGEKWLPVFTSFEEEMRGNTGVMSTFMADIRQLLEMALTETQVEGLLINPWNKSLRLDKGLIRIILGVM